VSLGVMPFCNAANGFDPARVDTPIMQVYSWRLEQSLRQRVYVYRSPCRSCVKKGGAPVVPYRFIADLIRKFHRRFAAP
jgi:hypothetical protein